MLGRLRYRLAVALFALAARVAGGSCLCRYCVAFAAAGADRRAWRRAYRAGWREVARIRPRRR